MSELFSKLLAFHSAPAICGIKASNLINCSTKDISDLIEEIDEVNQLHNPVIYIKILQIKNDHVLILVYRKETLESCLDDANKKSFLNMLGYTNVNDLELTLDHLRYRLNSSDTFPHEIGIFLGYDLSDVLGFINHEKCLYSGFWKVYSNVDEKKKTFEKFIKCKNTIINYLNNGYTLDMFMK